MSSPIADAWQEQRQRDLRRRIGRLRRRIERRIRAAESEARRLLSWRTYLQHWPGNAVRAALGVGLALSAGFSARRLGRWLGLRLIHHALYSAGRQFWRELGQIWADSAPDKQAPKSSGADDDRA